MELNITDVSYTRGELVRALPNMKKVRDAVSGEWAIKQESTLYLPRLPGHTDTKEGNIAYLIYLQYAHFYPATARTAQGLRGLVFRRDPVINIPEELELYRDNITADGQSLISFAKDVLLEVIQTNRCGIFVDFPEVDTEYSYSRADMEKFNIRPYVRMYKAETIINWRTEVVNNQTITSLVVLKEDVEKPDVGGFRTKTIPQYRVLYLDDDYIYTQNVYQYLDADPRAGIEGGMTLVDHVQPLVNGKYLDYIPFYPITDKGITWELTDSVLLPLAETNISHYRNSANRENALIWTGNPTPVFSGYAGDPDEGSIRLGSCEAILVQNGGSASFLEFTGQGLTPIKDVMDEKEEQMAVLGARIIAPDKRSAETAESAAIHRAGEQSVLADIANSESDGLTRIMRFIALYHGVEDVNNIHVMLNTDYMPDEIKSDMVARLGELYQLGIMSFKSYFHALQKGEIYKSDLTADEEYALIEEDRKKKEKIADLAEEKIINRTSSLKPKEENAENVEK